MHNMFASVIINLSVFYSPKSQVVCPYDLSCVLIICNIELSVVVAINPFNG